MKIEPIYCPTCGGTNFKGINGEFVCECGYELSDADIEKILDEEFQNK